MARYREIADDLRSAILNGRTVGDVQLTRDAQLPSHTELEGIYGVSRETIRRAVGDLVAEGLVASRGREGLYVRRLAALPHPMHVTPFDEAWAERARTIGEPSVDFDMRMIPAPGSVAARLGIEPDSIIVVRSSLRRIDGTPWSTEESAYPLDVARKAGLDTEPRSIATGAIGRLQEAGFPETSWRTEISARFATTEEQHTLAVGAGAALLICIGTAWSEDRAVRDTTELLPADRNVITEQLPDQLGR